MFCRIHSTCPPAHCQQDPRHLSASPLGSRINGNYPPAQQIVGSAAPIRLSIGQQDPRHLSVGPLDNRIHGTYTPAHQKAESTTHIRQSLGQQDPWHLSASQLDSRIHGNYPPAHWIAGSTRTAPIHRPLALGSMPAVCRSTGKQDHRHLFASPLCSRIHGDYLPAHWIALAGSTSHIRLPIELQHPGHLSAALEVFMTSVQQPIRQQDPWHRSTGP